MSQISSRADTLAQNPTRVISVDDNPMVGEVISMLTSMSDEFAHAAHFLSHRGVLEKLQREDVKLLVLDYEIPGTDTLGLIRDIMAACPDCRILMLSAHARPSIVDACRRAGAAGYAVKDQNPENILKAMQHVYGGQSSFYTLPTQSSWAILPLRRLKSLVAHAQPILQRTPQPVNAH